MENEQNFKDNLRNILAKKTVGRIFIIIKNSIPMSLILIGVTTLIFFMLIIVTGIFESINTLEIEDYSEEFKDGYIEDTFGFFNPNKIKKYQELERKSYPRNTKVNSTIITTINNNSTVTNKISNFNIEDITKEYRLYWQLIAAVDIISGYSEKENDNTVINAAEKYLMPQFAYTFDSETDEDENLINLINFKYNKTETIEVKKTIKTYKDGELVDTKTNYTKKEIITPQPYIQKVISTFFSTIFEYEKQVLHKTENADINTDEEEIKKYDKRGNIIGVSMIKTETTTLTKRKIEGYIIKNTEKTVNNKLVEFIDLKCFKNRLSEKDIYNIYDLGSQFKDSEDFSNYMREYLLNNKQLKNEN